MKIRLDEYIYKIVRKLTKEELIVLLHNSLDYMGQYNGRSGDECIALGMGCKYEPGSGNEKLKSLTLKKIKENLRGER